MYCDIIKPVTKVIVFSPGLNNRFQSSKKKLFSVVQILHDRNRLTMAEMTVGGETPPNNTIYINNLNEKIKLDGNHLSISTYLNS